MACSKYQVGFGCCKGSKNKPLKIVPSIFQVLYFIPFPFGLLGFLDKDLGNGHILFFWITVTLGSFQTNFYDEITSKEFFGLIHFWFHWTLFICAFKVFWVYWRGAVRFSENWMDWEMIIDEAILGVHPQPSFKFYFNLRLTCNHEFWTNGYQKNRGPWNNVSLLGI